MNDRNDVTSIRPGPPDIDPPKPRTGRVTVVRVELSEKKAYIPVPKILDAKDAPLVTEPTISAKIQSKDGRVNVVVPASRVLLARFMPGERYAYLSAEIFEKESEIELGERVEESKW